MVKNRQRERRMLISMLKWDAFSPSGIMRAAYERSKQVVQSVTKNWSGYVKFGTIGRKKVSVQLVFLQEHVPSSVLVGFSTLDNSKRSQRKKSD